VYETHTNRNGVRQAGEYGTVRIPLQGFVRSYRAYLPSWQGVRDLRLAGHAHAYGHGDRQE
jgi:hypothetical protein